MAQNKTPTTPFALEELAGYRFKQPQLLELALTHPSARVMVGGAPFNYQRLEFLGDKVLSLVIADLLYQRYPKLPEGALSTMHSHLVSSKTLADIASSMGLGNHLILDRGEDMAGGRQKRNNLENGLEALIGAVYLDSDFRTVAQLVTDLWTEALHKPLQARDSKSQLQEWSQRHHATLPEYSVEKQEGAYHAPLFTVTCIVHGVEHISRGQGSSRKAAEQEAALAMLQHLGADTTSSIS